MSINVPLWNGADADAGHSATTDCCRQVRTFEFGLLILCLDSVHAIAGGTCATVRARLVTSASSQDASNRHRKPVVTILITSWSCSLSPLQTCRMDTGHLVYIRHEHPGLFLVLVHEHERVWPLHVSHMELDRTGRPCCFVATGTTSAREEQNKSYSIAARLGSIILSTSTIVQLFASMR
jgi:hypothetical protein